MTRTIKSSSPALNVPYELTSKIFLLCLPRNTRVRPNPRTAPLLLAQICSRWRVIALSLPELWNSLFLDFDRRVQYDGISAMLGFESYPVEATIVTLVYCWLSRAASYPLSITITCTDPSRSLPPNLIQLLASKSRQLGRLELRISKSDLEILNEIISGPFPMLQTLAFGVAGPVTVLADHFRPCTSWNREFLLSSPNLKALRLGPSLWEGFPSGITDGLITSVTAREILEYLTGVPPHIEHAKIWTRFGAGGVSSNVTTIGLKTLVLPHGSFVLNHLRAPYLSSLDVSVGGEESFAITSFLRRSECTLTSLHIRIWARSGWDVCLTVAPSVIEFTLTLNSNEPPQSYFQVLKNPDLLPVLRTLKMRFFPDYDCAQIYDGFFSVLAARRRSLIDAELVLIHSQEEPPHPPIVEDLREVHSLRENGMHIVLGTQRTRKKFHGDFLPYQEDADGYDIFDTPTPLPVCFAPFQPNSSA
ncbi:F-box domain-containing protein [Favolaschia claudopus]|uniref:F-box domain-containing protein n=1 Tax=Favolaschia claudopus TaxID=2862362 RepID=A0AAV9Z1A3_9AGAR